VKNNDGMNRMHMWHQKSSNRHKKTL